MSRTAILLIDLLAGAFGDAPPRTCDDRAVLPAAKRLLERARAAGALVVHVVEDFDETRYPEGSPVWKAYQVHPEVAPHPGESIVRQHRYDAFCQSGLHELLSQRGVSTVVVGGISSAWCVDTAVRRAYGLGYRVVLAADAHGASDGETLSGSAIARHHNEILAACFCEAKNVEDIAF